MCVVKAFVIPSPSCWMVKIDGVGAVYEYPKKFLCLVDFQMWSAVCSISSGQGSVVTLWNIGFALGLVVLNLYSRFVSECSKKCCVMGPHLPCGLIAKGRRIIF